MRRLCNDCGREKPWNAENWPRSSKGKDGLDGARCKRCKADRQARLRAERKGTVVPLGRNAGVEPAPRPKLVVVADPVDPAPVDELVEVLRVKAPDLVTEMAGALGEIRGIDDQEAAERAEGSYLSASARENRQRCFARIEAALDRRMAEQRAAEASEDELEVVKVIGAEIRESAERNEQFLGSLADDEELIAAAREVFGQRHVRDVS